MLLEDSEQGERNGSSERASFMMIWQKCEKVLVLDYRKYRDVNPINEASEPILCKFEFGPTTESRSISVSQTCGRIKALFKMVNGPLIHCSENLKEKNTNVSLTRDTCNHAKKEIQRAILIHQTSVQTILEGHVREL